MKIRAEYLADKLPDFALHPAEDLAMSGTGSALNVKHKVKHH